MSVGRKAPSAAIARIESRGYRCLSPPYGGSVEHLPASFWARFEESLDTPAADDVLDASEWSLVQAARALGYHTGHEIISSAAWSAFIGPLDADDTTSNDVLHTAFATLTGLGLVDCDIVDFVPFERLVVRVYGYWGLLVPGPDRNRRTATLVVRGLCAAMLDLAYGGPYDDGGSFGLGTFACSQTRSVERGDSCDEFVVCRQNR